MCIAPFLSVASVGAQEGSPETPRRLFEHGTRSFEEGRYEEALDAFRRSQQLNGRPELFYNIGVAADRARRDQEALEAFEAYLAQTPDDAPRRDEVAARVAVLRRVVQEAASTEGPAEEPAPAPADEEPQEEPLEVPAPPTATSSGPDDGWLTASLVSFGLAAAVGGVAIGTGVVALDRHAQVTEGCVAEPCAASLRADRDEGVLMSEVSTVFTFVGVGVGLFATAALVVAFALPSDDSLAAELQVGWGSLAVRGRFGR